MIHSQDRSGWFGASDTNRIMGGWNTKTFQTFWAEKLGITKINLNTVPMQAGTMYEHRILDALGVMERDRQIKIPKLCLRVNLDGEDKHIIHEVKTYRKEPFRVSTAYWRQAQVEMYVANKPLEIDAYHLTEEDYKNYFCPIDKARITRHFVAYDDAFIEKEYLPRLSYLASCLQKGVWPDDRIEI